MNVKRGNGGSNIWKGVAFRAKDAPIQMAYFSGKVLHISARQEDPFYILHNVTTLIYRNSK